MDLFDWLQLLDIFTISFWQWGVPAILLIAGVLMASGGNPWGYGVIGAGIGFWFLVRWIASREAV